MVFLRRSLGIALLMCAVVACGPAATAPPAPSPTAPPTLTPVGEGTPKIPLRGLIDMQDISWHNIDNNQPAFDITNVDNFPGLFGGIVINATWSQMQPAQDGAVDFSVVDAALAQITAYNNANQSAPLGAKLRIYGGSNAPAWAKSMAGVPITIYRNPAGCGGVIDSCVLTVGPFWTQNYIGAWRAFQAKVAAKYDTEPLIAAVAVTSCASQTDEPFVPTTGPIGKNALDTAGYSDPKEHACLSGAIDDYAAWTQTDIDFTFNTYAKFTGGGTDAAFTENVMALCRAKIGARCVLDNHALQTPLTSDLPIYAAIQSAGGLIDFQTQSPAGMGCIWPETITQGLILGARAIEVWPHFGGFDNLTVPQVASLRAQFFAPVPSSTPAPNPLPTPCSGFN